MHEHVVFLLAQGAQTRMQMLLDGPKQLLPIGDTPLLKRTSDIVSWIAPQAHQVAVVPKDPVWAQALPGIERFTQESPGVSQMDILRNLRSTFGAQRTTFLHGDVIFSPEALLALLRPPKYFTFCTRGEWNVVTGNGRKEVYGFSVELNGYEILDEILLNPQVTPCFRVDLVWDLVAQLQEVQMSKTHVHRLPKQDYTDDVDLPDDLRGVELIEEFLSRQAAVAAWRAACDK